MMLRVTGEDGADEFLRVTEDMFAPEYDVSIQEAPETPEDKQETAVGISAIGDKYLSVGDTATAKGFHNEAIQLLPGLDGDVRNRLSQILQPQQTVPMEVVQQLQATIEQLQSELTKVQMEKTQSETQKNLATVQKTLVDSAIAQSKGTAETAKILEEASRIGKENDLITSGKYESANVNI